MHEPHNKDLEKSTYDNEIVCHKCFCVCLGESFSEQINEALYLVFSIHENSTVSGNVVAFDSGEKGIGVSLTKATLFFARECERRIVKQWGQAPLFIEKKIKGKSVLQFLISIFLASVFFKGKKLTVRLTL